MNRNGKQLLLGGVVLACALVPRAALAHPPPFYWMADVSVQSRAGVEIIPSDWRPFLRVGGDNRVGGLLIPASAFAEFALGGHLALLGRVPLAYVNDVGGVEPEEGAWTLAT
jgi:hypothetical protein